MKQTQKQKMEQLNKELDSLENICFAYKKQKSFNLQLVLTGISCLILYCQQYILKNNIDIGLKHSMIIYIGVMAVMTILFGWISHFLEFHTKNFKTFKIGKLIIWGIELVMIGIFVFLLL